VRNKEGSLDAATVGVLASAIKQLFEDIVVADIDSVIEGKGNHLRNFLWNKLIIILTYD
jgi:hypothetical protein